MEGAISRGNGGANPNGELGNGVDTRRGWKCEPKRKKRGLQQEEKNNNGKKRRRKELEILLKAAERIFVYRRDPASEYLESISGGAVEVKKNERKKTPKDL